MAVLYYGSRNGLSQVVLMSRTHYADSAPQVAKYLADLNKRICGSLIDVSLWEVAQVMAYCKDGVWMSPEAAIKQCVCTMDSLDMDTSWKEE